MSRLGPEKRNIHSVILNKVPAIGGSASGGKSSCLRIAAIASLTIRIAINSRVFSIACASIMAVLIGLPFIIKGDGTPESIFYIFINYSLGLLIAVLSLLAAWCGAAAVSLEIDNRQMQLLSVKPLRAVEIWTGKLLGLMIMNVILLFFTGVLLYAMLQWSLASAKTTGQDLRREIMTVYRPVLPKSSEGAYKPVAIDPGQIHQWSFDLPYAKAAALIKYRFIPSPFAHQSPMPLDWRASTEKNASLLFSNTIASSPHMVISFRLAKTAADCVLKLDCRNMQTNPAVTVFFPSEHDLQAQIPEGNFETNLARALIMILARLCFFASLGMLAGTLFSFPVASFVSLGLLAVSFSGGFVRQLAETGMWFVSPNENLSRPLVFLNDMVRTLFRSIATILPPLDRFDPLAFLPNGTLIPMELVGQALLVLCVLYSLILVLAGAFCLSRREIGLPTP